MQKLEIRLTEETGRPATARIKIKDIAVVAEGQSGGHAVWMAMQKLFAKSQQNHEFCGETVTTLSNGIGPQASVTLNFKVDGENIFVSGAGEERVYAYLDAVQRRFAEIGIPLAIASVHLLNSEPAVSSLYASSLGQTPVAVDPVPAHTPQHYFRSHRG